MKTRLITAAVGVVIAVAIFIFSEMNSIVIAIAAALVCAVMCGEYLSAKGLHKNMWLFIPGLIFGFLIPALSYSAVGFLPLYVFVLYLCIISVVLHKTVDMGDIFFTFFGIVLISVAMALFNIRVCALNYHPSFWAVLILGVPWIADSAAYFTGSALGKRKLSPEISPKKTVEGALGGLLCGTLSPFVFALVFMLIYGGLNVTWWVLPIIGLLNSVISIFGDLLFSVVKRSCDIKDYGSIMPGHGGLLDRFDSVILCVPVVFIISQYVPVIS